MASDRGAAAPGWPRQVLSWIVRRVQAPASGSMRMHCIHHRLYNMGGHRFNEAVALEKQARLRGLVYVLYLNLAADDVTRRAIRGRPVLSDPVFQMQWSFDERTARFVSMLDREVSPFVRRDDRVLLTVATQCEGRALVAWLRALPAYRKPWVVCLFVSDRWNRYTPAEKERQLAEFAIFARELASLAPADARRLLFLAYTEGLARELRGLLGAPVAVAPPAEDYDEMVAAMARAAPRTGGAAVAALPGGSRAEKGSHLVPAIIAASQRRGPVEFLVELLNEGLLPETFAELAAVAGWPGVRALFGPVSPAVYTEALATTDLVVLPYEQIPYRQRISGIQCQAAACGLPSVVPAGTWMAEQIESGKTAGVVFARLDPDCVADAITRAIADLAALKRKARTLAPEWRRTRSLGGFLDDIETEIAARARQ